MKRYRIVISTLLVVSACFSVIAAPSLAEVTLLAEWLLGGEKVVSLLMADWVGKMLFEDINGKGEVSCSATFDGAINSDGVVELTAMLTSGGVNATLAVPIT
ncbi:MAG: hypothetical protein ACRDJ3_07715, partial [Solirubrobacteraceae bacterium]